MCLNLNHTARRLLKVVCDVCCCPSHLVVIAHVQEEQTQDKNVVVGNIWLSKHTHKKEKEKQEQDKNLVLCNVIVFSVPLTYQTMNQNDYWMFWLLPTHVWQAITS